MPLIDTSKQPACYYLYPLDGEEITTLKKQIIEWLKLGHIIPSANLYGHYILFAENKGGGSLHLYINYCSLNTNTVINAWPLLHINDLLPQLKGARVLSCLDLWDGNYQMPSDPADRYKWHLNAAMSSMSIQLYYLGLRKHQFIFNII